MEKSRKNRPVHKRDSRRVRRHRREYLRWSAGLPAFRAGQDNSTKEYGDRAAKGDWADAACPF